MLNLQESLQKYIVQVPFIKKNGEERLMICTLIPDMLPEVKGEKRVLKDNLLTVFDIENDGWRTINLETIIWEGVSKIK